MRRAEQDTGMEGQDSFLDVVTNIVGILILLVMVMGVRALRAPQESANEQAAAAQANQEVLKKAFHDAMADQTEVRDLVVRTVNVHRETLQREQERDELAMFVASVSKELEDRRAKLDSGKQDEFDQRRKLVDAKLKLEDLNRQEITLMTQAPEVEQIENLPTPIAQTVTGKEVHLRVADGHVAFIPLDDLLVEFKEHAENNVWRLRDQNETISTIGPVDGFRLRYCLRKGYFAVGSSSGVQGRGTVVQLVKWELIPVIPRLGEPVEQALLPDSDLNNYLARYRPDATTVTIWIYPDSFKEFRELRRSLFERGYATAARPLPQGVLIGGSPSGSKSAAQ